MLTSRGKVPAVSALKDGAVFRATSGLVRIIAMEMGIACMENVTVTAITVGQAVRRSHARFNAVTEEFVKMHRLHPSVYAKRALQALDASTQHVQGKRAKRGLVTDMEFVDAKRHYLAMEIAHANVDGKELDATYHFAQNSAISEESVFLASVFAKRGGQETLAVEWNAKIFARVTEIV